MQKLSPQQLSQCMRRWSWWADMAIIIGIAVGLLLYVTLRYEIKHALPIDSSGMPRKED